MLPIVQAPAPPLQFRILGATDLWRHALADVRSAKTSITLASMVYDNPKLQKALLAARAKGVAVKLLVDKMKLKARSAPMSHGRLKVLKKHDVKIWLCTGKPYKATFGVAGHPGVYHCKGIVVDGAISYIGGGNLTDGSEVNGELWVRAIGAEAARGTEATIWSEASEAVPF